MEFAEIINNDIRQLQIFTKRPPCKQATAVARRLLDGRSARARAGEPLFSPRSKIEDFSARSMGSRRWAVSRPSGPDEPTGSGWSQAGWQSPGASFENGSPPPSQYSIQRKPARSDRTRSTGNALSSSKIQRILCEEHGLEAVDCEQAVRTRRTSWLGLVTGRVAITRRRFRERVAAAEPVQHSSRSMRSWERCSRSRPWH